ncbi:MAG: PAS domain S-box protein, partial [Promethearchaeota archaeon]
MKDYNISGTVKDNRDIYRSLFNGSPSISLLLDTKGYIKDVNKVAEIFLQENKENLIDKFLLNLKIVNKNNINEFRRLLKAIQICKKIKSLSLDLKLKKGTYWFKVNLNIIDNQKHPIIHVTFQDISYLKFVEIELEKQKHQLNFFLENIDDLIIIIDKNFLIKKINKIAFKKILGYDEQNIIGHRILEFVHKADQEKAINIMKDTILRGRKYGKNIRFKAKNGRYLNGEIKFQSIFHEKEFINFLIIIKIKSKQEERILRSKNLYEKYKTLIKKLPEVVFEIDKNYKIIYTN